MAHHRSTIYARSSQLAPTDQKRHTFCFSNWFLISLSAFSSSIQFNSIQFHRKHNGANNIDGRGAENVEPMNKRGVVSAGTTVSPTTKPTNTNNTSNNGHNNKNHKNHKNKKNNENSKTDMKSKNKNKEKRKKNKSELYEVELT